MRTDAVSPEPKGRHGQGEVMKILVIEDKAIHQESARETLIGHEVTVVPSYNEAYGLLKWKKEFDFDAVLTDMNMPMSERNLSSRIIFRPDEQVPYGFILALAAAYRGAKYVALVTDINHHYGAMSAALDLLAPEYYDYRNKCMGDREKRFYINGARVIFVHAPFVVNIIKDQPCDLCTENPGVCTYCQGSGKRT